MPYETEVLAALVAPYETEVLADSPRGYWRFSETSGPTVADSSGNGFTGDVTGVNLDAAGPTDALGSAAQFDGVDDHIVVSSTVHGSGTNAWTWEAWVFPTAHANQDHGIITAPNFSVQPALQWRAFSAVSRFQGICRRVSDDTIIAGPSLVVNDLNTWYHVVLTVVDANTSGATSRLYVDDGAGTMVLRDTVSFGEAIHPADSTSLRIGTRTSSGAGSFPGRIDEPAAYNTALSLVRIQAHHDAAFEEGAAAQTLTPASTVSSGLWVVDPDDSTTPHAALAAQSDDHVLVLALEDAPSEFCMTWSAPDGTPDPDGTRMFEITMGKFGDDDGRIVATVRETNCTGTVIGTIDETFTDDGLNTFTTAFTVPGNWTQIHLHGEGIDPAA